MVCAFVLKYIFVTYLKCFNSDNFNKVCTKYIDCSSNEFCKKKHFKHMSVNEVLSKPHLKEFKFETIIQGFFKKRFVSSGSLYEQ